MKEVRYSEVDTSHVAYRLAFVIFTSKPKRAFAFCHFNGNKGHNVAVAIPTKVNDVFQFL